MIDLRRVHPAEIRRLRRRRDLANSCFLFIGAAFTAAFLLKRIPTGWAAYRIGAAVLSHPLVMVGLVAGGVIGVALAIAARAEPGLRLLALATVALPAVLFLTARSATIGAVIAGAFFPLFTVACLVVPLLWFLRWRRRWRV